MQVSELFSSPLLFFPFTGPFAPFLAPLGFQPLSPGLLLLSFAGIPYFAIIHPQKSPTQGPSNFCFLPFALPCVLFSRTKGKEMKTIKKVSSGVGWHFQKHL